MEKGEFIIFSKEERSEGREMVYSGKKRQKGKEGGEIKRD